MVKVTPIEYKVGPWTFQFDKHGKLLCPVCNDVVSFSGQTRSSVHVLSPAGHDHSDTWGPRSYVCALGRTADHHFFYLFKQSKCTVPECDWVGKPYSGEAITVQEWPEEYWKRMTRPTPGVPQIVELDEGEKKALIEHNRSTGMEAGYWDHILERDIAKRREFWESQLGAKTNVKALTGELFHLQVAVACEKASGTCSRVHDSKREPCTPETCMSIKEAIENSVQGETVAQMQERVIQKVTCPAYQPAWIKAQAFWETLTPEQEATLKQAYDLGFEYIETLILGQRKV